LIHVTLKGCELTVYGSVQVTRDKLMDEYDEQYPQYGFKQHKGYGTVKHMAAAERHPTLDSS
jgi:ribonuclease HII